MLNPRVRCWCIIFFSSSTFYSFRFIVLFSMCRSTSSLPSPPSSAIYSDCIRLSQCSCVFYVTSFWFWLGWTQIWRIIFFHLPDRIKRKIILSFASFVCVLCVHSQEHSKSTKNSLSQWFLREQMCMCDFFSF